MPIGIRTTGPQHLFCVPRGQSQGLYLGTCVAAPEPEHEKHKIPVMNDIGGRSVPFQLVMDGENAVCVATLNRFNYALLQSIRALESGTPFGGVNGNALVGTETGIARGTLYMGVRDWGLAIANEYAGTPAAGSFAGPADLIGVRFYYSANLRLYKESTQGTRVLEVALRIECENLFRGYTGGASNGFVLYREGSAGALGLGNLPTQLV